MYAIPLFLPAGDQALVVELGDAISPEINRRVHDLLHAVEGQSVDGIVDLVPSYRSLLVEFDPMRVAASEVQSLITQLIGDLGERESWSPRVVMIPVLYGGDYGPDVDFVAEHNGLTHEEVVTMHSGADYLVYMMGFSPGFPYLGGLREELVTPRLPTPRVVVPAGSVGIAEAQTGVYPVASPGGWRLIGRTPVRLFDAARQPPAVLNAGDYIRFVPITDEEEYLRIERAVKNGEYEVAMETVR